MSTTIAPANSLPSVKPNSIEQMMRPSAANEAIASAFFMKEKSRPVKKTTAR